MVKISIIIPIYNAENYIESMLESIISQNYKDYELILVNDGSVDNSKNICEKYAIKNRNIKLINSSNHGSGYARNIGIDHASGEYAYFPDADDILLPNALELMSKEIDDSNADLYIFGYAEGDRNGLIKKYRFSADELLTGEEIRSDYLRHCQVGDYYIQGAPWNKLFKLENISKFKVRYPDLKRNQDEVFIMSFVNDVKFVKFSRHIIYHYFTNDIRDQWLKFPLDYFEIRTMVKKYQQDIIIPWNYENSMMKIFVDISYLLGVLECFKYSYSEKWRFDKLNRKRYIESCLTKNEVEKSIEDIRRVSIKQMNTIMKWNYKKSLAFRVILFLMANRKVNTLNFITKLRVKI